MRTVVVYESMFGNTRAVAEAIAAGLRTSGDVEVVHVADVTGELMRGVDLVVVGGPTHAHGMSRRSTRLSAVQMAHKPGSTFTLDPDAERAGLREWLADLPYTPRFAAAFDTRIHGVGVFTGRASKVIGRRLRRHGLFEVAKPESFLVTGKNVLVAGELERAQAWGRRLAATMAERTPAFA